MPSPIRLLSIGLTVGLILACSTTDTTTTTPDSVTLIAVDPVDFPKVAGLEDAAQCRNGSGSYVAELIDVSRFVLTDYSRKDIGDEFLVRSSPATACNRAVAFSEVVANREYIVRLKTYPDSDADPNTIDVCTVGGTGVTVPKVDGVCSETLADAPALAQPSASIVCYGWQASGRVTMAGNADAAGAAGADYVAGNAGQAGSSGAGGEAGTAGSSGTCDPETRGCPGTATGYRTVTLRYCVPSQY